MPVPERDDTRALTVVMHTAFFVLLSASVARYLARHADGPHTPWVIALSVLLAALYVLVLTTYDTDADVTRAVDAGATGYLLKAERAEDLFTAIHAAAQGRPALSPPVADRVMSRLRNPRPTLTPRELDILTHLSRGLSNHAIARALYISEATVKTHLRRVYDKLGVDTRAGAVAVAKEQRLLT